MNEELKPCPFCGKEPEFVVLRVKTSPPDVGWVCNIRCSYCHSSQPKCYEVLFKLGTKGELRPVVDERNAAIEVWNRRANDETD